MAEIKYKRPGDTVTINGVDYRIKVVFSREEKAKRIDDLLGVKLGIQVKNIETGRELSWEEMRGSYESEKIVDFCRNCINGQRSFYWNWEKEEPCE